ncbi:MAG: aspartate aminotransferase family protein [Deltaproteobacteria bacterium]|nr:aspartate aminotransferase family protein [Deltaproteobacteria bacterium]
MHRLLDDASRRAQRYLNELDARPVFPSEVMRARLHELGGPLPEEPTPPGDVLALLDEVASPATVASAGRRYYGFVTGGALPATVAASWLATAWDQNCFTAMMSPAVAAIEQVTLGWLLEVLGLPREAGGAFVTGATMANLAGLAAARRAVLARAGWDVDEDGLQGGPRVRVVVGAEVHSTLRKALGILGLGRSAVQVVPVDAQGRLRADALPALDGPTIVCLQAGNVNSGAFDPAAEVCAAAHAAGAWVHVDGAFGLWAAACPARAHLARGFADADSWATDAHKWLNVPYDSGLVFVRDAVALRGALSISAPYLQQGAPREPGDFTPESSRRARAVEVWAALRSLGSRGLAELIERNCRQAQRFAARLSAAGAAILNDVVLNQLVVSFGDEARNRAVLARITADGTCWCGPTVWRGRAAMRISVSSWATTDADVERSIDAILASAEGCDAT